MATLLLSLLPALLGAAAASSGCPAESCTQRFWGSDASCPPGQCAAADWEAQLLLGAQTVQRTSDTPLAPPASSPPLLLGDDVVFVGRVQKGPQGSTLFDMNGVQIKTTVTGTTGLSASLSQVSKAMGNVFQVYLDGVLQPKSRFNTSAWAAGQVVKVPLFPAGSLDAAASHAVTIFKDTEPCFAGTHFTPLVPNYITFHGFSGDDSSARLLPALAASTSQHKVEFLGDSITAGFDNQCDISGSPKGFPWSESFAKSWAALMCNELGAECHYNAWSGLGMVRNCCGGATLGSDVWTRTLATVSSTNTSDQHGTTTANEWDFSSWKADAVVINLGTNDHLGTQQSSPLAQAYKVRYLALVAAAAKVYGKATGFFLACGPMSTDYCPEVEWVISRASGEGIKAYLLNQSSFEDGAYGKKCAYGHPGSQDDAAMAKAGSTFIKTTMGW